ncbi:MAG: spore coat protein CotJB [Bacilli bacterium]|nr:spore coat protein CotJB [Bacilli bacterium]MDD2932159.1 spore coat protein CotJB [Fermentimonas sp.]MDD3305178.1 spore coat protein CotJB [Bacilli bacterium]MDD4053225.1 spore coat protein CotJB [Bacilli bacterium]MDD4411251.1 spore coat protein CotJB [Bacilli bacterium]
MYNYSNYNQNDYLIPRNTNKYLLPTSNQHSPNITNSYEGFIRGNIFTDLYEPYIAGEPFNLNPRDEREALLNKVREYDFSVIDLGLYLDTHPQDGEKIRAFNQSMTQYKNTRNEYENRYGPLSLESETLNSYPWAWISSPWPWEVN